MCQRVTWQYMLGSRKGRDLWYRFRI
ncbi:unnamed protein product [Linum tenue]|uniref:Uncharacterized protein n=1 Tax=Linum tenue TaxID=586396 RepID=A0AAV0H9B4_9ROSI|nr:unnamed protein product [Linum tenue]